MVSQCFPPSAWRKTYLQRAEDLPYSQIEQVTIPTMYLLHLIASYCWSITCLLALLSSRNATRLRLTTHFLKAIGAFRRELAYDCGANLCSFSPHRKSYDAMLPAKPCRLHQLHQRGSGRPSHWLNRPTNPTNPTRISCIKLDLFGSFWISAHCALRVQTSSMFKVAELRSVSKFFRAVAV